MSAGGDARHIEKSVLLQFAAAVSSRVAASLGLGGTFAMPAAADPALLPGASGTTTLLLLELLTVLAVLAGLPNLQHVHRDGVDMTESTGVTAVTFGK
jgi:hypothetical protein